MSIHFSDCIAAELPRASNEGCPGRCADRLRKEAQTLSGIADYMDEIAGDILRKFLANCPKCDAPACDFTAAWFNGRIEGIKSRAATLRKIDGE